jgi:hypothetical protein
MSTDNRHISNVRSSSRHVLTSTERVARGHPRVADNPVQSHRSTRDRSTSGTVATAHAARPHAAGQLAESRARPVAAHRGVQKGGGGARWHSVATPLPAESYETASQASSFGRSSSGSSVSSRARLRVGSCSRSETPSASTTNGWVVRGGPCGSEADWRGRVHDPDAGDLAQLQTSPHIDPPLLRHLPMTAVPLWEAHRTASIDSSAPLGSSSACAPPIAFGAHGRLPAQVSRDSLLLATCYTLGCEPTAVEPHDAARSGWSVRHLGRAAACSPLPSRPGARRRLVWGAARNADDASNVLTVRRAWSLAGEERPREWRGTSSIAAHV